MLTGRAMDINAVSSLLAMCFRLSQPGSVVVPTDGVAVCAAAICCSPAPVRVCVSDPVPGVTALPVHTADASHATVLHAMATAQEQQFSSVQRRDIWCDPQLLDLVLSGSLPDGLHVSVVKVLQRRASSYRVDASGTLHRRMADGSLRIVPSPDDRERLVRSMHERTGHFGEKRTAQLLLTQFWWYGLFGDVNRVCRSCQLCRRVNASFNARSAELQPLPIMGLFYRWGVDLCGEFLRTPRGNRYVMVCVEYFSKHVELIPLPDKKPETTAYAFLSQVLSQFGSCAEVVTDQGTEWRGSFDSLLESCFIDHRTTAPNHPQADGLAERVVQTIKRALRKHCEQSADVRGWDEGICWIALGYRCSPQASTGFSPYELLYARRPVVPPAIVQSLHAPLCFDSAELAAESLLQRAKHVQRICPEAFGNLLIAQHRDSLRYAMVRSGSFQPTLVKFFPGQFVYVQRPSQSNTLQVRARPEILRVVAVNPGGAVTLQGKCGRTVQQNVENLAPCFLPNIDPTIDATLAYVSSDHPCEVCRFVNRADKMLLCDNCNTGWHIDCLVPALPGVPAGVWLCPYCVAAGVDLAEVEARQAANQQAKDSAPADIAPLFSLNRRRMVAEAESMHGRWLVYPLPGPAKSKVPTWGVVEYLGEQVYPRCLRIHYPTGVQHDVTLRTVRKYLQGSSSQPPRDVQEAVPALSSLQNAAVAISDAPAVSAVPQLCEVAVAPLAGLLCEYDLIPLLQAINLRVLRTVVDPVGSGLVQVLPALSARLWFQHAAAAAAATVYGGTASQPARLSVSSSSGDALIVSLQSPVSAATLQSWFGLAPVILVKLEGCQLHTLSVDVQRWLHQLHQQQRLHVVIGSVQRPSGHVHVCLWLCMFADPATRLALVDAAHYSPTGLCRVAVEV